MIGGFSPLNIAHKMMIGFILILLWIPAVFYSEINNKGNKDETKKLLKELDNSFLKTGKIINDSFETDLWGNKITFKKSIGGYINFQEWKQYMKQYKDSSGRISTRYLKKWSKPIDNQTKFKNFTIKFKDGTELYVDSDMIDSKDLYNILAPAYKNDVIINNNGRWDRNIFYPNSYKRYLNIGDRRYNIYKIPTNKTITVFAKDDTLKKIDDDTTKLLYKGRITKNDIIRTKQSSNTMQRWLFRISAFLALFIGLSLIAEPIKEILEGTSNVFNFPILNILKPIINAIGGIVIFLWESFSFLGALILTVILTAIVYFLVNYTLIAGIGLAVIIVILLIPQFMNK